MSHDEKSQAQQDKEGRVKKVEENLKKEYTKLFDEHQKAAEGAREDNKDHVETEEEYRERVASVPGLFSDSYAYGVNQAQADDLQEEANDTSDDSDSDNDSSGNDVGGDPDVANAASKVSPASDNTKPATALQNQKRDESKKDDKKDNSKRADVELTGTVSEK